MFDKAKLLATSGQLYSYYYRLGDTVDCYYSSLVPSTGFISRFDIVKYYDGLLLRIPNKTDPEKLEDVVKQEKMLDVFQEYHHWNQILGISTVGDLNVVCREGRAGGHIFVLVQQSFQDIFLRKRSRKHQHIQLQHPAV